MKNLVFIKTLIAGVSLAILSYSQAKAEIKSAVSCDGKCTYYYDTVTHDMRWEKNANVGPNEEVIIPDRTRYIVQGYGENSINNLIIGEGITGLGVNSFWSYGGVSTGNSSSTLVLPSTLKSDKGTDGGQSIYYILFGTIDASALKDANMSIAASSNLHTLIVDQNSTSVIKIGAGYGNYPTNVTIQCKGEKRKCQNQVQRDSNTTNFTISYYTGLDENGNYIEWSDNGLAVWADSTKAKPLGTYDFSGNAIDTYKYDGAGNLTAAYKNGFATYKRTSYTPAEAAAAVKKGNNNKVTLTFK